MSRRPIHRQPASRRSAVSFSFSVRSSRSSARAKPTVRQDGCFQCKYGIVPFHSYGLAGDFHPGAVRHRECVFRDAREYGPLLPLQYDITRKIPRHRAQGQADILLQSAKYLFTFADIRYIMVKRKSYFTQKKRGDFSMHKKLFAVAAAFAAASMLFAGGGKDASAAKPPPKLRLSTSASLPVPFHNPRTTSAARKN